MSQNATATDTSTDLARERSREAADRTLMAWIRTSLSLIGFGFTIAKFYDYLEKAELKRALDPMHSTLLFGGSFIALGIVALLAAVVQNWRILERIEHDHFIYKQPRRLPMLTAIILLLIGLYAFLVLLL